MNETKWVRAQELLTTDYRCAWYEYKDAAARRDEAYQVWLDANTAAREAWEAVNMWPLPLPHTALAEDSTASNGGTS